MNRQQASQLLLAAGKGQLSALIQKYAFAVPRYTSYPTAVEFSSAIGPSEWKEMLGREFGAGDIREQNPAAASNLSLYIHIPFCRRACTFCACNRTILGDLSPVAPYLSVVKRELAQYARTVGDAMPVEEIHWGGGSPNILTIEQMEDLHRSCIDCFSNLRPEADVSIEADPRTTTPEQLMTLRRLGFNRLSMGVQDFDPEVQRVINRPLSAEQVSDLQATARELGYSSVNLDLIYGLPLQTLESFEKTISQVQTLRPDRIALYGYAHVPWVRKAQQALEKYSLPSPEERVSLFLLALSRLCSAGYEYIGLDHFALPSDQLSQARKAGKLNRNFMGYNTHLGSRVLAFGATGISLLDLGIAQNERDVEGYQQRISAGNLAVCRGLRRTRDDQIRREVIETILCSGMIDKTHFEKKWDICFDEYFASSLARLAPLEADGLVNLGSSAIAVTDIGRIFLRVIASSFDAYLAKHQSSEKSVFSQSL